MLQIYTIKNIDLEVYGRPMYFTSEEHCKSDTLKFFETQLLKEDINPSHFEIFYLGEFDEIKGELCPADQPELITNISELLLQKAN